MLKSLANDYLTESRSLLHEAALVAEEEARNRNQWAEKARKHAYKLERIVIKWNKCYLISEFFDISSWDVTFIIEDVN